MEICSDIQQPLHDGGVLAGIESSEQDILHLSYSSHVEHVFSVILLRQVDVVEEEGKELEHPLGKVHVDGSTHEEADVEDSLPHSSATLHQPAMLGVFLGASLVCVVPNLLHATPTTSATSTPIANPATSSTPLQPPASTHHRGQLFRIFKLKAERLCTLCEGGLCLQTYRVPQGDHFRELFSWPAVPAVTGETVGAVSMMAPAFYCSSLRSNARDRFIDVMFVLLLLLLFLWVAVISLVQLWLIAYCCSCCFAVINLFCCRCFLF